MTKTNRSAKATVGVAVAACAACCAPLVIPPLAALFAAGGLGLAVAGQIGLGVLVLVGIGGYLYLRHRNAGQTQPACGCEGTPSQKGRGDNNAL